MNHILPLKLNVSIKCHILCTVVVCRSHVIRWLLCNGMIILHIQTDSSVEDGDFNVMW